MAMSLSVTHVKALIVLLAIAVFGLAIARELFVAAFGNHTPLKALRVVNLDSENSLPTWLSSLVLACSALTAWVIGGVHKGLGDARLTTSFRFLAIVFLVLAADEAASLHEASIKPLKTALGTSGVFTYAWLVAALPCLAVVVALLMPMLLRIPRGVASRFVAAGAIYCAGAVGMEMVGGLLDDRGMRFMADGVAYTTVYQLVVTVEETLEILGLTLFLCASLDYLAALAPNLSVSLAPETAAPAAPRPDAAPAGALSAPLP